MEASKCVDTLMLVETVNENVIFDRSLIIAHCSQLPYGGRLRRVDRDKERDRSVERVRVILIQKGIH